MNPQSGGAGMAPIPKAKSPILLTVILVVLLIAAIGFGFWAFSGQQDYKNNADKKIAAAVAAAKTAEDTKLQKDFASQLKQPYKSFSGPATFGSVAFSYPKTYSAYVDQTGSSEPLNAYFYPSEVPGITSNASFALRIELVTSAYKDVLNQFSSDATAGKLTIAAYVPPKMMGVKDVQTGSRLDGAVGTDSQGDPQTGAMIIIPVRDKTLKVYTESSDFLGDFNNIVAPSLTFVP